MLDRFCERVYVWWFKTPGSSVAGTRPSTLTDEQREKIARESRELVRSVWPWWYAPLGLAGAAILTALIGWLLSLFR